MGRVFSPVSCFLFSYPRTSLSRPLKLKLPSRWHLPQRFGAMFNSITSSSQSHEDFKYRWIDDVERLERYQPGGYHPVHIGEILAGRYRVVHKLGYGTYSTVWLTHDMQEATYTAVKISTADAPAREVEALNTLAESSPDHPNRSMIPIIQDQFELQGPNGRHRCYTTFPARSSVSAAKFCCCFPIAIARAVAAQLILAVAYTHSRGFVHGGRHVHQLACITGPYVNLTRLNADIHLGNILLRLPSSFDQLSTDLLYEQFGEPRMEPVVHFDGKSLSSNVPSYGTVPV